MRVTRPAKRRLKFQLLQFETVRPDCGAAPGNPTARLPGFAGFAASKLPELLQRRESFGLPGQSPGTRMISPSGVVKLLCPKNRPSRPSRVRPHSWHLWPSHRCRAAFLGGLGPWTWRTSDFKAVSAAGRGSRVAVSVHRLPEIVPSKGNANCRGSSPLLGWSHVRGSVGLVECCGICGAVPSLVFHAFVR